MKPRHAPDASPTPLDRALNNHAAAAVAAAAEILAFSNAFRTWLLKQPLHNGGADVLPEITSDDGFINLEYPNLTPDGIRAVMGYLKPLPIRISDEGLCFPSHDNPGEAHYPFYLTVDREGRVQMHWTTGPNPELPVQVTIKILRPMAGNIFFDEDVQALARAKEWPTTAAENPIRSFLHIRDATTGTDYGLPRLAYMGPDGSEIIVVSWRVHHENLLPDFLL